MNEVPSITSQDMLQRGVMDTYPELVRRIGYPAVVEMIRRVMDIKDRTWQIFYLDLAEERKEIAGEYRISQDRIRQIRDSVNEKLSQIYDVEEYVVKARRRGIENALILWENTDPITILLGHNLGIFRFGSILEDFEMSVFTVKKVLHERGRATLKQIEKGDILPILVSVFRENLTLLETAYKLGRSISYVYLVVTVFVKKSECE